MRAAADAIDKTGGTISSEVFSDEMYQRELERLFARSWLFVGHETLIPKPGDYFTSYMGEEPVVVQRDQAGKVRVYLNRCRHRGNALCVHDRGNAKSFTCSYHGWAYTDGALIAVPLAKEAYFGELEMKRLGLIEPPKVQNYRGMIFACWDADAQSLDDFLGDAKWWLDNFLIREELGGLEIVPGPQRYIMPINWKLLAENFAGDDYHFMSTHSSLVRALSQSQDRRIAVAPVKTGKSYDFSIAANFGRGVPHGFLEVKVGPASLEQDMATAERLGPEAVDWVKQRERLLDEKTKKFPVRPYSFHAGNVFPNLALIGVGSAFYAKGLILHHPRSARKTEVWMWCALEKGAPESVKKHQRFVLMQRQAAAGMVAPDDHENFERIAETVGSTIGRHIPYHYAMALGRDDDEPRPSEYLGKSEWPGKVLPQMTEVIQRDFYRYWQQMVGGNR